MLGGVAFHLSFCVLMPSFSSFGWGCFLTLFLLGGVAFSLLFWVVLGGEGALCPSSPSSFDWACLPPLQLRGAALLFLPSGGVAVFFPFPLGDVVFCSPLLEE